MYYCNELNQIKVSFDLTIIHKYRMFGRVYFKILNQNDESSVLIQTKQ